MYLNKYEKYIFEQIETKMVLNKAYNIDKDRTDYDNFISAIKKRIDLYGDCEFNSNYSKFRKTGTWEETLEYWKDNDGIKSRQLKQKK